VPVTILYVITELNVGGAEKALYELVRRLDRERYRPEVACLSGSGAVGDWLAAQGVPVHFLGMPERGVGPWEALRGLCRLRRLVRLDRWLARLPARLAATRAATRARGVRARPSALRGGPLGRRCDAEGGET